jgi:adenosyl cobinamide kinase/adenosyl cobinamide phosphate guanylyltransferase
MGAEAMSNNPIETLWDNDRAMREIISLRQQLADSQRREAVLRDALTKMVRNGQKQGWNDSYKTDMKQSKEALAATEPKGN